MSPARVDVDTESHHWPFTSRFKVIRRLGEGSFGVVHEVHDQDTQRSVAAKSLKWLSADGLFRIKHEFRRLARVAHPNLVRLYELFVLDQHTFFTMELVHGVSLSTFGNQRLWEGAPYASGFVLDRLVPLLRQLVVGLSALHRKGLLHRDVKPSNTLVERNGRLVLLDFGLATSMASRESVESREGVMAGTLAYMSPEQAFGLELTPAADWYSVGASLYELVTGSLPPRALLAGAGGATVTPPSQVVDGVPEDLDRLILDLMSSDPERRPQGAEILARLPSGSRDLAVGPVDTVAPLVGRAVELGRLHDARRRSRQAITVVSVRGPSGIGKTRLVGAFTDQAEEQGALVLRGECHPRERVPFNALDRIMDSLARAIVDAHLAPEVTTYAAELLHTFPVLGRLQALQRAAGDQTLAREAHERRRRAFLALRRILVRLAEERSVVLWIDDAQWGDADSLEGMAALARGGDAPKVMWVLTSRPAPPEATSPLLSGWGALPESMVLSGLSADDVATIVSDTFRMGGIDEPGDVSVVVEASRGNPSLAVEFARALITSWESATVRPSSSMLDGVVERRLAGLPVDWQRILEIVAVAGHPVHFDVVAHMVGVSGAQLWELADATLVRVVPHQGAHAVGMYHDGLSERVLGRLAAEERRAILSELVAAFERFPGRHDESLVDLWSALGDPERAVRHAEELGDSAVATSAFFRGASLYRRALERSDERGAPWRLHAKLAGVLVSAGRSAEAGEHYLAAAGYLRDLTPGDVGIAGLLRRAAAEFLRGGDTDRGVDALGVAMPTVGLRYPHRTMTAVSWIVLGRLHEALHRFAPRWFATVVERTDQAVSDRLQLLWDAGQGLTFARMAQAAAFQARHGVWARRSGDAGHLARSLATNALFQAWERGEPRRKQCDHTLNEADQLAMRSGDPRAAVHVLLMRSTTSLLFGAWRRGVDFAEEGLTYAEARCEGASWEVASLQQNVLVGLAYLGEALRGSEAIDAYRGRAERKGDQFATRILPGGPQNWCLLAARGADAAERALDDSLGPAFTETSEWYAWQGGLARIQIDLYRRDFEGALARQKRVMATLSRSWILQLPSFRYILDDLGARAALGIAETVGGADVRAMVRIAKRAVRRIEPRRHSWFAAANERSLARVALLEGRADEARLRFERSIVEYRRFGMVAYAAAAQVRLARLEGNEARHDEAIAVLAARSCDDGHILVDVL